MKTQVRKPSPRSVLRQLGDGEKVRYFYLSEKMLTSAVVGPITIADGKIAAPSFAADCILLKNGDLHAAANWTGHAGLRLDSTFVPTVVEGGVSFRHPSFEGEILLLRESFDAP
jgi:hypothetical protein